VSSARRTREIPYPLFKALVERLLGRRLSEGEEATVKECYERYAEFRVNVAATRAYNALTKVKVIEGIFLGARDVARIGQEPTMTNAIVLTNEGLQPVFMLGRPNIEPLSKIRARCQVWRIGGLTAMEIERLEAIDEEKVYEMLEKIAVTHDVLADSSFLYKPVAVKTTISPRIIAEPEFGVTEEGKRGRIGEKPYIVNNQPCFAFFASPIESDVALRVHVVPQQLGKLYIPTIQSITKYVESLHDEEAKARFMAETLADLDVIIVGHVRRQNQAMTTSGRTVTFVDVDLIAMFEKPLRLEEVAEAAKEEAKEVRGVEEIRRPEERPTEEASRLMRLARETAKVVIDVLGQDATVDMMIEAEPELARVDRNFLAKVLEEAKRK